MRLIVTLIIVILTGLAALYAGWPGASPAIFESRIGGVPGSILVMSVLLLAFVVIAAVSGGIARKAGDADREAGR